MGHDVRRIEFCLFLCLAGLTVAEGSSGAEPTGNGVVTSEAGADPVGTSREAVRFRNAAFVALGIGAVGGVTAALSFRPTNSKNASPQVRWGIGAVHLEGRF
jgi:hypothetical protein